MTRRKHDPDKTLQDEQIWKGSIILTQGLRDRIQSAQEHQQVDSFSQFIRQILLRHLHHYEPTGDASLGAAAGVHLEPGDETVELLGVVARKLGRRPEDLVRSLLVEHLPGLAREASERQEALRKLRNDLEGDGKSPRAPRAMKGAERVLTRVGQVQDLLMKELEGQP